MTPKQINRRATTINNHIKKWNAELRTLQVRCPHENATHVNRANTGNWCKSDDSYWTDHDCPDCGRRWSTDQDWNRKLVR